MVEVLKISEYFFLDCLISVNDLSLLLFDVSCNIFLSHHTTLTKLYVWNAQVAGMGLLSFSVLFILLSSCLGK